MYQQLINLELKTDLNGAIRGYGKASIDNLQNKVQIPLIEDLYPCFMCNLCNNILSINIFVSIQQQQPQQFQSVVVNNVPVTPQMFTAPIVNLIPVHPLETQQVSVVQGEDMEYESSEEESESDVEETDEESGQSGEDHDVSCDEQRDEIETEREEDLSHDSVLETSQPYSCLTCETSYNDNSSLCHHYRVSDCPEPEATNPYSCDTCGRSYKTRFARYHHYKKRECSRPIERKRPPYVCEICKKTLTTRRGYMLHMKNESNHTKSKPKLFECPECHKVCKSKVGLKTHRFLHLNDNERPFQCRICNRGFASKLSFQIHELVHTKVKKYACTVCDDSYDSKEELRKHMLTHAEELGEAPQNCNCLDGQASSEVPEEQQTSDFNQEESK